MTNPVVLITGGGRGIGEATALDCAANGFDVVITYASNEVAAELVVSQIRDVGQKALAIRADVASEQQTCGVFERIDQEFGRLDGLVNNAGVLTGGVPFEQYTAERMQWVFNTNILGSFIAAREAVKRMSTEHGGEGGAIVNVSSAASRLGAPGEYIDYAASKGAIDSMTIGLAKEVAEQGIRVNGVRPGLIHTDIHASGGSPDRVERMSHMIPMKRGGSAQEVADVIVWLLSGKASYVTGTLVDVSGGR